MTPPVLRSRASSSALLNVYRSSELQQACSAGPSSPSSSALSSSASSVVESDTDYFSDGFCDTAVYSPTQAAYPAFHLPLSPRRVGSRDSDTPSLSTSTSFSSLSTPSLSRTSSIHRSPPVSPTSLSLATPLDSNSPQASQFLQAIEEAQTPEDAIGPWDVEIDERRRVGVPSLGAESSVSTHETVTARRIADGLGRDLETLRLNTASPATIIGRPSSPRISSPRDTAPPISPKSQRTGSAFSRLFSKSPHKGEPGLERSGHSNGSAMNLNMAKAEEKKRKKLVAKELAERLTSEKLRSALDMRTDGTIINGTK